MFKNLILSAAAAGLVAGLVTAALQHVTTTPLIIAAEAYESEASAAHQHTTLPDGVAVATHDAAALPAGEREWVPGDGIERTFVTSIATVVLGVGFALALLGAMVFSGRPVEARRGLAFGAAAFAAMTLAPALGLPPELPGNAAADLAGRQAWWLFAAASTAVGLAALLLGGNAAFRILGIALIAVPHVIGAPQPPAFASTAPAELAGHFAAASLVVSAVFWAVLGAASGAVYERLVRSG
jgi:cobalt transporter subunit CbtA